MLTLASASLWAILASEPGLLSPPMRRTSDSTARVPCSSKNDAVIDGVAGGNGVDVDFSGTEGVANASEHAGTVIEKESELGGDLHNRCVCHGGLKRLTGMKQTRILSILGPGRSTLEVVWILPMQCGGGWGCFA